MARTIDQRQISCTELVRQSGSTVAHDFNVVFEATVEHSASATVNARVLDPSNGNLLDGSRHSVTVSHNGNLAARITWERRAVNGTRIANSTTAELVDIGTPGDVTKLSSSPNGGTWTPKPRKPSVTPPTWSFSVSLWCEAFNGYTIDTNGTTLDGDSSADEVTFEIRLPGFAGDIFKARLQGNLASEFVLEGFDARAEVKQKARA